MVEAAMLAFWRDGVAGTSLPALEAATGVDRSTIYNSFGGKAGLHVLAADRYAAQMERDLFGPLRDGCGGLADVSRFLDGLADGLASFSDGLGCLILNELGRDDVDPVIASRFLDALAAALDAALARAVDFGELDRDASGPLGATLLAALIGVHALNRALGGRAAVERLAALRSHLDTLRR